MENFNIKGVDWKIRFLGGGGGGGEGGQAATMREIRDYKNAKVENIKRSVSFPRKNC